MKSICVFCGSSSGKDPAYAEAARRVGRMLAEENITLIYGGGHVGLMGTVADAALEAGGEVVGVMPKSLIDREIGHKDLTRLHVVGSMHERKALMSELSDGFVALPGGVGTLEEFAEVFTWALLGEHRKPCGLLNVSGYYDLLLEVFDRMKDQAFLKDEHRRMVLVAETPRKLLEKLRTDRPPPSAKWVSTPDG